MKSFINTVAGIVAMLSAFVCFVTILGIACGLFMRGCNLALEVGK